MFCLGYGLLFFGRLVIGIYWLVWGWECLCLMVFFFNFFNKIDYLFWGEMKRERFGRIIIEFGILLELNK